MDNIVGLLAEKIMDEDINPKFEIELNKFQTEITNSPPESPQSEVQLKDIEKKANAKTKDLKQIPRDVSTNYVPCNVLVERIHRTVYELENSLEEDQEFLYKLKVELERETGKGEVLVSSLEAEKQRNRRLMQLVDGVNSPASSTDEDADHHHSSGALMHTTSRPSCLIDSISPLLMQQRYDELYVSHKKCCRQLAKKERLVIKCKCEREELTSKYDELFLEYRKMQRRCEDLCAMYLRLQTKKNKEIMRLRDTLNYASDCIVSAKQKMNGSTTNTFSENSEKIDHFYDNSEFQYNLELFIKALRRCEWVQVYCKNK